MIQLSSFQFENEQGETLHIEVDRKSCAVKLKSDAGFTVNRIEDFEKVVNQIAQALIDLKEINRKK